MSESKVITKSNNLIEARYKLTVEEQRVILFLVSMIQPLDEDFKNYKILVKDFMQLADVKNKGIYKQFMNISEKLISKTLTIKKDNSTLVMSWLSSAEYFEKQGKIELSFDPKLKPYLLKLKSNFTTYKLENVIKLKSTYSIRIYELLKQYEKLKERTFDLRQLRNYLCIEDNQYPMYANFKQKVLSVAKKELKEKSDIFFEIEEEKVGRKIEKIRFLIYKNSIQNELILSLKMNIVSQLTIEQEKSLKEIKTFISETITENELLLILESAGGNVELIRKRYEIAKNKRHLDNFVGFMIWACGKQDDEFKQMIVNRKSKFNNYDSRNVDYEELERLEMEKLFSEVEKIN